MILELETLQNTCSNEIMLQNTSLNLPLIAFMTDFGRVDPCVGICEGVMYSIAPQGLRVVHLNHNISPQDIQEAMFNLRISYAYFPNATIFCCVVDPGVGSSRRAIAAEIAEADKLYYFVGPDNGLISALLGPQHSLKQVVSLDKPQYHLAKVSKTFHGRDIFSPISAYLAQGIALETLGTSIDPASLSRLSLPQASKQDQGFQSQVIHIDHFGNLVTNLKGEDLKGQFLGWQISFKGMTLDQLHSTFADAAIGEAVSYVGSSGFVEIAIRNGNAAQTWGISRDETINFRQIDI
ncbi:MAG: SAM-dependent chlorinase/fluorinase [Deinococcales bacterium]